jgi:drug/metabolite transporter (DMT)-like permease
MEEIKAYIAVVLCQLICVGNYILSKDVLNGGMPTTIFTFYRLFVGTLIFAPFALIHGRYVIIAQKKLVFISS